MPHLHISSGATPNEGLKVLSLVPVDGDLRGWGFSVASEQSNLPEGRHLLDFPWQGLLNPVESLAQSISVSSGTVGLRLGWGENQEELARGGRRAGETQSPV